MTKSAKDTIMWLVNKELEEEYEYQRTNKENGWEVDISLIKNLINVEKELMYDRAKGIDKLVWGNIIKDDIDTYLKEVKR